MKTLPFFLPLLMVGASLMAESDPAAVLKLQKAAELHGLAVPKALTSVEMDFVFSGLSGGVPTPSRWLSRIDFTRRIDLGVRYAYETYDRGAIYQRRIEGDGGYFLFGIGSPSRYELGSYLPGNAVDGVSTVAILAVRDELKDVKQLNPLNVAGTLLDQIAFTYHGGKGTLFLAPDGRYAGRVEVNLKDNVKYFLVVTAYQNYGGLVIPSRFSVYDERRRLGGYGKLAGFRANPEFTASELETVVSEADPRGLTTAFGVGFVPSDASNFLGLKVADRDLSEPAKAAGLKTGDEIVSINGEDVRMAEFFALEERFWKEKTVTLGVVSGGASRTVKLAR